MMEIKICGITSPKEAEYLNKYKVDYAGFVVFFEKSKRYVTLEQAKSIFSTLDPEIKKVAVTVSPTVMQVKMIEDCGFDILQVHKELSREILEQITIPVWYAFNVANVCELEEKKKYLEQLPKELANKIVAIVLDGSNYGSGIPFDWESSLKKISLRENFHNRKIILAGGLTAENVARGIRIFQPDMVDVSSGVEGEFGKEETKIKEFVAAVKNNKAIRKRRDTT